MGEGRLEEDKCAMAILPLPNSDYRDFLSSNALKGKIIISIHIYFSQLFSRVCLL